MDKVKAIGIVLVVVGHAPGFDPWLIALIYSFHMPLFFLASGYLLSERRMAEPWGQYVAGRARTLLVPYLLFFVPSYGYWLLTRTYGSRAGSFGALPWYDPMLGLVMGHGPALYINTALWFFPCLFVALITFHALRRVLDAGAALAVCGLGAFAAVLLLPLPGGRLPWCIENAVVALGFVGAGHWAARRPVPRIADSRPALFAFLVASGALTIALCLYNGRVDLNKLEFGAHPWAYLPNALAGIVFMGAAAALLRDNGVFRWLAANTLTIFPLHVLAFNAFTGIGVLVFGLPFDFKNASPWFGVLYTVGALAASYPMAWLLAKILPSIFGESPPRKLRSARDTAMQRPGPDHQPSVQEAP